MDGDQPARDVDGNLDRLGSPHRPGYLQQIPLALLMGAKKVDIRYSRQCMPT